MNRPRVSADPSPATLTPGDAGPGGGGGGGAASFDVPGKNGPASDSAVHGDPGTAGPGCGSPALGDLVLGGLACDAWRWHEQPIGRHAGSVATAWPAGGFELNHDQLHGAGRWFSRLDDVSVATFAPAHYEPGYAYPLIVWLHGAADTEADLAAVMAHVSTRNYVAAAPAWEAAGKPWVADAAGIVAAEAAVFAARAVAARQYHVHAARVFLVGSGRGGTAALRVALANPGAFAGAASLDGPLPTGHTPLAGVKRLRGLPLMLGVGQQSPRYPQPRVCRDLRLLHSAGCRLHLRQEPGDGSLTESMLAEVDRWAMSIVCPDAASGA